MAHASAVHIVVVCVGDRVPCGRYRRVTHFLNVRGTVDDAHIRGEAFVTVRIHCSDDVTRRVLAGVAHRHRGLVRPPHRLMEVLSGKSPVGVVNTLQVHHGIIRMSDAKDVTNLLHFQVRQRGKGIGVAEPINPADGHAAGVGSIGGIVNIPSVHIRKAEGIDGKDCDLISLRRHLDGRSRCDDRNQLPSRKAVAGNCQHCRRSTRDRRNGFCRFENIRAVLHERNIERPYEDHVLVREGVGELERKKPEAKFRRRYPVHQRGALNIRQSAVIINVPVLRLGEGEIVLFEIRPTVVAFRYLARYKTVLDDVRQPSAPEEKSGPYW